MYTVQNVWHRHATFSAVQRLKDPRSLRGLPLDWDSGLKPNILSSNGHRIPVSRSCTRKWGNEHPCLLKPFPKADKPELSISHGTMKDSGDILHPKLALEAFENYPRANVTTPGTNGDTAAGLFGNNRHPASHHDGESRSVSPREMSRCDE